MQAGSSRTWPPRSDPAGPCGKSGRGRENGGAPARSRRRRPSAAHPGMASSSARPDGRAGRPGGRELRHSHPRMRLHRYRRPRRASRCAPPRPRGARRRLRPVGAENSVTAADLVIADVCGFTNFGIWLCEHSRIRHCQFSCHYDSPTWRCSVSSAGSPCSPAPTGPRTPRSSSCATRSPCFSARPADCEDSCPGAPRMLQRRGRNGPAQRRHLVMSPCALSGACHSGAGTAGPCGR